MRSMVAGSSARSGAAFAAALAFPRLGLRRSRVRRRSSRRRNSTASPTRAPARSRSSRRRARCILHPRCVNCHPAGDTPTQGMDMHVHQPPVIRGDADIGAPGMMCTTCHGADNFPVAGQAETIKSIPGNPAWHLAPIEMAWAGKSLGEICAQIKDPAANGGRRLDRASSTHGAMTTSVRSARSSRTRRATATSPSTRSSTTWRVIACRLGLGPGRRPGASARHAGSVRRAHQVLGPRREPSALRLR